MIDEKGLFLKYLGIKPKFYITKDKERIDNINIFLDEILNEKRGNTI